MRDFFTREQPVSTRQLRSTLKDVHVHIRASHGPVEVSAGNENVVFRLAGREVAIVWSEITGAGLARPASVPIQFPRHETELLPGRPRQVDIVPFGNRLADLARRIHATHRALVVAYGAGKASRCSYRRRTRGRSGSSKSSGVGWVSGGSTETWNCEIFGSSSGSGLVGAAVRLVWLCRPDRSRRAAGDRGLGRPDTRRGRGRFLLAPGLHLDPARAVVRLRLVSAAPFPLHPRVKCRRTRVPTGVGRISTTSASRRAIVRPRPPGSSGPAIV